MATVLCPSLVALDPVPCNDPKCSASHTHTPAFCDPCKAVHAQVHSSIHLASIGHRLRVDGPVAPVRCIVCCPLGTEPVAQFLFIGPEHYAVHARTSAHRAKLAKFPTRKPEAAIGLGRPGDRSFAMDRPYAPRSATPPRSMTMPASGPGSRSSTSMSFGGDGGISAPPGPAPVPLGENEYVLCTLCHTVLPVPPVDPAYAHDPKLRIASQGSDATVVGHGQGPRKSGDQRRVSIGVPKKPEEEDDDEDDNDHDGTSTILTTTDPKAETETRKSLVLAHHNAHDTEHARRMRFPRFKEAWERRMRKQTLAAGEETPPEEEHAPGTVLPGQIAASPSQLSLSSLSASPSVAMMGLDGDDVYETYTRAREVFDNRSSVSAAPRPPPPPPPPPEPEAEEESLVDWESKLRDEPSPPRPQPRFTPRSVSSASSSSAPSASDEGRTYSIDSNGKRFGRDSSGRAFPVDENGRLILNNGTLPVQIPAHLLPFMSPMTPSMAESLGLDSGSEDGFKDPGPPPPLPTPSATTTRKSVSPKPTAMVFKDPGPPPPLPKPQPRASTSSPQPRQVSSPQSRQTTFSPPPQPRQPQPRQTSYSHPRQATASPQPRQTSFSYSRQVTASPLPMSTSSTPPPPPSISASVTSSTQSKPYVPSPSPPPRLAFDTYGRVLKLGMRGWEMDLSGEHAELQSATTEEPPSSIEPPVQPQPQPHPQRVREVTPEPPRSPSPPSDSLPSRSPSPEPEPEPERYGRPPSPATEVGVSGDAVISAPRRYTLGQVRSVTSGTASRTVSASGSVGGGESSRASSSMSMHSTSTGGGSPGKGHTRSASSGLGLSGTGPGRSSTTSTGRSSTMSAGLGFGGVGTGFGGPGFGAAAGDRGSFPSTISGSSLADSLGVRGGGVAYPAHTTPAHANTISVYPSTTTPAYSGGSSIYQSRTTSSSSVKTTGSTGYTPPSLFQTTGPTTKVTRPVAPRRSTGEWTLLEGQGQGQSQREESGWSRPGSALSGGRLHKAPSPELSAIGDGEEDESESEPKSHSEASQLIREFAGKTTTSKPPAPARTPSPEHIPTPERKDSNAPVVTTVRIHSRTTSLSNRPAAATSTRPVTSTGSLSSRPSTSSFVTGTGSLSSRPVTSTGSFRSSTRPIGSTSSLSHRPVASTTPRAFSPSPAWKSLTPASPESQSSSEVDEFGAIGFGAEPSSFDEAKFLSDLGFGLGLEQRLRKSSPSPEPEPEPEQEEEEVEHESSTPSREASPVRSASPPPRLSTPPIRVASPPVRVMTPPARVASPPIRAASPPIRVSTPPVRVSTPPVRASSPLARAISPTDSRPTTPTPAVSSISSPPRSSAPSRPSLPARNSTIRATPSPRSTPARNSTIRATPSPVQRAEPSPPRPTPNRNSTIRARAPSPLQREVLEAAPPPPPVPVPASPVPAPSSPRDPKAPKPVMRTRVRARPMGTSSSVVSGGGGSVISGYGGRSVVSGYGGGSVVSGNGGGSVVSGYDGGSVVSGTGRSRADSGSSAGPPSPIVSQNRPSITLPRQFDLRSRGDSIISDSEAPSSANRPSLSLPRPLELRSRGDSIISSDSEAPSSVVTPLSPRTRNTLRSHGLEVETPIAEERDSEVEEMADNLAGMNLRTTTDMDEARIGTIERVDTSSSGFTSPIVPDGAPSDAGSLFSRAVSPQPMPTIARMTVSRSGTPAAATTSTKTPPVTPPKATQRVQQGLDETPKSQRSAALPGGFSFRPESPVRGKGRATGSVFSRGPGSSYSRGGDELKWKLDLPSHTSDPLTFQSLLGGVESEGDKLGLGDTPKRAGPDAGEITNASPRSERLTPTRSSIAASEGPLKGPVGGANEGREEEEEEEQGGDEWEQVDEQVDQEEQEEQEEVDRFTSSSEEGARTETATNTDGLDHLTESINEPFGLQLDNQPLVHEQPIFDSQSAHHQPNGKVLSSGPVYDSPRLVSPPALPGGFEAEPIAPLDPEFVEQPAGMEYYGEYEDQMSMPDEVLALRPVMCDACRAPMPLSKWAEHIAKAGHRRNAAHYAQWLFDQITAHHPAGPSRDAADTRERWAEASRLDPRDAHPSEYAFCEVCQVFLIRGDTEHFQGKKHLRCLRELAIHDADGLSSIRGSVSDEEDGPSAGKKQYRPMQVPVPVTASQAGVDWTQPRVRSRPASGLGHQAFPSANPTM